MSNRDKLYGRRWRKARRQFLTSNPLCCMCQDQGHTTIATEVDHIIRHKGDPVLFWDESNWQPLCAYHHRNVKASIERSGKTVGSRSDGTPIDPAHHWRS